MSKIENYLFNTALNKLVIIMKVSESVKVSESMTKSLVTVNPSATAEEVAKRMQSENVGTVLVLDQEVLKGLVTDRQIAVKVIAAGEDPSRFKVSEFMTRNPLTCSPDMGVCEAAKTMGERGYRRMPVIENNRLVGILSAADIANHAKSCNLCTEGLIELLSKTQR